jgi:DNA-binding transcriptional regulator YiaG
MPMLEEIRTWPPNDYETREILMRTELFEPHLRPFYKVAAKDHAAGWPMTGAAHQATRELLGLSRRWVHIQSMIPTRTVRRWETGNEPVPATAQTNLDVIAANTRELITRLATALRLAPAGKRRIITYRDGTAANPVEDPPVMYPASWHRAAIARLRHEIPDLLIEYNLADSPTSGNSPGAVRPGP